jgi:hypothetical protein
MSSLIVATLDITLFALGLIDSRRMKIERMFVTANFTTRNVLARNHIYGLGQHSKLHVEYTPAY